MNTIRMPRIINLHEVNSPEWFESLIIYLNKNFHLVTIDTLNEYYNGNKSLRNICHITVDDGEKSFYETIFPVLKKYKIPASLFVSPRILKERNNYWFQEINNYQPSDLKKSISIVTGIPLKIIQQFQVPWILKTLKIDQIFNVISHYQNITGTKQKTCQNISLENLLEISDSGLVTIGAHTLRHPILSNEDSHTSEFEIVCSIKELSGILGKPVNYFAYPNGNPKLDFSEREENVLLANGIKLAVTTQAGNFKRSDNIMRVPRFGISDSEDFSLMKTKLLLGGGWNNLRKVFVPEEVKERKQLMLLIDRHKN